MSTRPPAISDPERAQQLDKLRSLVRALDLAFRIPGTRFRVGLDSLIGLVPGVGDVAGGLLAGGVLVFAARLGASPPVLARMLLNVTVDVVAGLVPVLGDIFDVAWKANARNLALLERHLEDPRRARRSSLAVVAAVVGVLLLLLAAAAWAAAAIVGAVLGAFA